MKLTVNVTERDIKYGKIQNGHTCPVARACRRLKYFRNYKDLAVSVTHVYLDMWLISPIPLPYEAKRFIQLFDRGQVRKPFKFEIEVPDGKE